MFHLAWEKLRVACKFMHCPFVFILRGVLLNTLTFPWFVRPSLAHILSLTVSPLRYLPLLYISTLSSIYINSVLHTTLQLNLNIIIVILSFVFDSLLYVFVPVLPFHPRSLFSYHNPYYHPFILILPVPLPLLFILTPVCTHNPVPLLLPYPVCGGAPTVGWRAREGWATCWQVSSSHYSSMFMSCWSPCWWAHWHSP